MQDWFAEHGAQLMAAFAAAMAAWAAWTNSSIARAAYRPLLRATPAFNSSDRRMSHLLLLKNLGRGPAFNLVVVNAMNSIIGELDMIDVLQAPRFEEEKKAVPGRSGIRCTEDFADGHEHRIYYQDIMGWWHTTTFRFVAAPDRLVLGFHGGHRFASVPAVVRRRGQVRPASAVDRALAAVATEHEILRERFRITDAS